VDVVCISLPNNLHEAAVMLCCKHKKAVITTKPLGRNAEEAKRMLEAVEKAGIFNGYLEDYAFLIDGLLALYETTGELRWFSEASSLTDKMIDEFWDQDNGGFYFTGETHEDLIVRSKDYFDNATPSGNSVAAGVLLRLALLTDSSDYRNRAVTVFDR
jgi:uncharacterized protein YyaL (SSP411 family)